MRSTYKTRQGLRAVYMCNDCGASADTEDELPSGWELQRRDSGPHAHVCPVCRLREPEENEETEPNLDPEWTKHASG